MLVTSHHTKAVLRIALKKGKQIDGICFCKDCNLFPCTPSCHDVHKQSDTFANSYKGQECPNHNAAKTQNFMMIEDARITDKAVKYTDCNLQNDCH